MISSKTALALTQACGSTEWARLFKLVVGDQAVATGNIHHDMFLSAGGRVLQSPYTLFAASYCCLSSPPATNALPVTTGHVIVGCLSSRMMLMYMHVSKYSLCQHTCGPA